MVDNATDKESKLEAAAGYRGYVLFMLIVVYTFNFIDRQIIGILAVPIQAELGVSDTMMGVMRGVAFAQRSTNCSINGAGRLSTQ